MDTLPAMDLQHDEATTSTRWGDEETRLRQALCRVGALAYQKGLIAGADGNLSARMTDGTILITPAGAMKGFLRPQHIAHIDIQGRVVDDGPGPSSEFGIHQVSYRERPDIRAVVHAHPPHAVALSIAEIDLQLPVIPEIVATIGGTPTTPYATPGTDELPESIRETVRCSDTLIMKNHGAVTLGSNLMDAFKKLDMVEHAAHILWLAHTARGGIEPLPAEAVEKLLRMRRQLGIETKNTLETRCGNPPIR
jgi:L-fuculose-phosphate aldolase